jgi:hypothetical protein
MQKERDLRRRIGIGGVSVEDFTPVGALGIGISFWPLFHKCALSEE